MVFWREKKWIVVGNIVFCSIFSLHFVFYICNTENIETQIIITEPELKARIFTGLFSALLMIFFTIPLLGRAADDTHPADVEKEADKEFNASE